MFFQGASINLLFNVYSIFIFYVCQWHLCAILYFILNFHLNSFFVFRISPEALKNWVIIKCYFLSGILKS